ncbi:MAG: tetratricopeptide repeat protein [Alphaproteobacteria bacterium]|nr:tetratricopeptide repeat protein [Alphaproteobacteria bacterium]
MSLMGASCDPEEAEAPPVKEVPRATRAAVSVELARPSVPESIRFPEELRGLITVMLELGLSELEGVVPHLAEAPPPLGLQRWPSAGVERWSAVLSVEGSEEALSVELSLCPEDAACELLTGAGTRAQLHLLVAGLLSEAALAMRRAPDEATLEAWAQPLSADPYAVLLSGRAAASWYGYTPAIPEELQGDARRDPIQRAALVDPHCPSSAWLLARRDAARGEPGRARAGLARGLAKRDDSSPLLALDATLIAAEDRPRSAYAAWARLAERRPDDPRFVLPLAEAALKMGDPARAAATLDTLPERAGSTAEVVALRVRIADAQGGADDLLLAQWQLAAPEDPEPVRRRVLEHLQRERYAEAFALLEPLAERGAEDEARALAVPLALGAGEPEQAIAAAEAAGDEALAERVEVREGGDPSALLDLPEPEDADDLALRIWALQASGQGAEARSLSDAALKEHPWDVQLLEQRVSLLEQQGDPEALASARTALKAVDPLP